MELGVGNRSLYEEILEAPLLDQTREYYQVSLHFIILFVLDS